MRWILIAGVLIAIHAFAADGVSTDNKTAAQIQAEFEHERATQKSPPRAAPSVAAPAASPVAAPTDNAADAYEVGAFLVRVAVILAFFMLFVLWLRSMWQRRGRARPDGRMICPACNTRGEPISFTRGSIGIEIVLWLLFIVPGLIYSLWRLSTRTPGCPTCGQPGMIPVNTPRGQQLLKNNA